MIPRIVKITKEGRSERDIFSLEYEENRIIRLTGEVNEIMADEVLAKILYLDEKSSEDITVYINSPGGVITAGLAIVDAMHAARSDVKIIVTGMAASMGAFIAACGGTFGKRYITANAEMMIHQPLGGIQGQASDVELTAAHIVAMKKKLNEMLAESTGQNIQKIARDTDRDYYLNAKEAVEYGLVDGIL